MPESGGKVMQERSEKRFLHHFLGSARRSAHLRPAPRLGCNSKAGKSKTGAARGQSLFLSAFAILRLRRIPFAVFNPAAVQDSFPS